MSTPEQDIQSILESIYTTLTNLTESVRYLDDRITDLDDRLDRHELD